MVARMELKVWVEGIQRIVCGVTDTTTCQDVVYALAHATGKTGRFTLIERWRNNERLLAPNEYPLKILMKWGEYSNDVQFILQRSALDPKAPNGQAGPRPGGPQRVDPPSRPAAPVGSHTGPEGQRQSSHTHKDLKKSLTFSGGHAELRRQEVGVPPQPLPGPAVVHSGVHQGPRHNDPAYSSSPVAQWEGQGRAGEGSRGDQQTGVPSWRPPAPPPYELVRGNPPPPPPVSRVGVDNVRATTSHWTTPRQGPHSPTAAHHSPPSAIHHSPTRSHPSASESAYTTSRRDQRADSQSMVRTEPVYSDGRRGQYPGYPLQGAGVGINPGPQYGPRGHAPPSQVPPMYNGPPPKPPHPVGPRELPPYRHPPPPTSSPNKVAPSHGSPRKIGSPPQPPQMSPNKQQPPPTSHVPHLINKASNPHQSTPSPHSSPVRHPSPTRHPSPSRHPSPTRAGYPGNVPTTSAASPINHIKGGRPGSPIKSGNLRHVNSDDSPNRANMEKPEKSRASSEEPPFRHGENSTRINDGTRGDNARETDPLNNNMKITLDPKISQRRGSMDRLGVDGGNNTAARRGGSEEPATNNEGNQSNLNEKLNTSLDSALSNHNSKSPHARRSPAKESGIPGSDGGRTNHNNKVEQVVMDGRYRDLIRLINLQREKLNVQQVEMTKYEAEIVYLEGRTREDESRLAYVTSEIERQEQLAKQIDEEVTHLQQLEQEAEIARQEEDKVKAEISALQAQLAHTENQLATHAESVRSAQELEKSMTEERQRCQEEARAQQDAMVREIEKLQAAISQATVQAEHAQQASQQLAQEMAESEKMISEKKKEVEKLVMEMKDANLESLSITPSEEIRTLLEGKTGAPKQGSSRRMIGSPRQLENAVPTSKNPHGVWV